jgi:hypothetical protein
MKIINVFFFTIFIKGILYLSKITSMFKKNYNKLLLYNNLLKRVKPILKTDLGNFIK